MTTSRVPGPVAICAFDGWNDAAGSATATVELLSTVWAPQVMLPGPVGEFYDYQVARPIVENTDDGRVVHWPETLVGRVRPDELGQPVVLVRGPEPNYRWREFAEQLADTLRAAGVRTAITLGAMLTDEPHTQPMRVIATSEADDGPLADLPGSTYEGPTGILGVIADRLAEDGIDTVSLWAAVPHYAAGSPCPKATLALLRRIEDLLDVSIPEGDLPEESTAWERGVSELVEEQPELAEYVRSLEQDADQLPEATGESIAREFERYLRRQPPQPPGQP